MAHTYKYLQIREWLLENIKNGHYQYGEMLPSENHLCKKFSISRQTARNAVDELVNEGVAVRVRGSGTYVAKKLCEVRNKTIGIMLSYQNDYIFPQILLGIESTLTEHNYGMDLGITYNKLFFEKRFLERMLDSNISGLLVEGTKTGLPNPNLYLYREFIKRKIPIVFIHNSYPRLQVPSVVMDDVNLSRKMTKMLIEAGHKNIGGIFKFDDMQGQRRYQGYVQALTEADIPVCEECIGWFSTDTHDRIFRNQGQEILEKISACTAVVCYNDEFAERLYDLLINNGIRVPDDVSLVGFDNHFPSHYARLQLTTAQHPQKALGVQAARLVLQMIESGIDSVPAEQMEMTSGILVRKSIKNLNLNAEESVEV